jgi:hypothetical protein
VRGLRSAIFLCVFVVAGCPPPIVEPTDVAAGDILDDVVQGCGTGPACIGDLVCDPSTGTCVGCINDGDCVKGVCHPQELACVACLEDDDCTSGRCHPLAAICVQCLEDHDCAEGVCDGQSLQCIGCLDDEDCESGVCNTSTRSCVGCASDKTCTDLDPCTIDTCLEGSCTYEVVPTDGPCDDEDPCTLDETCVAGLCVAYLTAPACCDPFSCDGNHTAHDTDKDGCDDACTQNTCKEHGDCGDAGYCYFEPGVCGDEPGLCVKEQKPCEEKEAPICGCDGLTYGSACFAAIKKVSVLHKNPCEEVCEELLCPEGAKAKDQDGDGCAETCVCPDDTPTVIAPCDEPKCESSPDCKPGQYCFKIDGICEDMGTCLKMPDECQAEGSPVCGCDGETYASECHANQAGVTRAEKAFCK